MKNSNPSKCFRCKKLVKNRNNIVNGKGSGKSGILLIGEAPGKKEDELGKPFVGQSGKILSKKLKNLDIKPQETRITNIVRCRPPENRNPYKQEIKNCREYLENEIEKYDPNIICTLGLIATTAILEKKVKMKNIIGDIKKANIKNNTYTIIPCYHPASILYDRSKEKKIEKILKKVSTYKL